LINTQKKIYYLRLEIRSNIHQKLLKFFEILIYVNIEKK
jgi:hypothetical protein